MENSIINNKAIIEQYCLQNNLMTSDPYDIWKTRLGIYIKKLYYKRKYVGMLPAFLITLFDIYINNKLRFLYTKQEYPIVRAQAALSLFNLYKIQPKKKYLQFAEIHIDWLIKNNSKGYSGYCWGINFYWVSKNAAYSKNAPHVTHTPYVLEALIMHTKITNSDKYKEIIRSVFFFLENDINVLLDSELRLAVSYSPLYEPLIVINANSYVMYMYVLLLEYMPEYKDHIASKISRIYNFIIDSQNENGSWEYYFSNKDQNFIDCFHSCFILKNLIKTSKVTNNKDMKIVIAKGYEYVKHNFYDHNKQLFKRFTINDKPSIIHYDLYDNAEMLQLSLLINDIELAEKLTMSIDKNFIKNKKIYSVIDYLGFRHNEQTLRWAVLPYLYSLSFYQLKNKSCVEF